MFIDKFFPRTLYDLFAEFVDRMRAAVSIDNLLPPTNKLLKLAGEPHTQTLEMNSAVGEMIETLVPNDPQMWFIKMVEDSLRKFPDYIMLGEAPLAGLVGVKGETQVARGKQLQQLLQDAIESLRPAGTRPAGSLPRTWYNYIVLHDAYVEGVQNYEVMARLYISEGTFNRTRRIAVRGVAICLIERMQQRRNIN
jgi:hypothetical protein